MKFHFHERNHRREISRKVVKHSSTRSAAGSPYTGQGDHRGISTSCSFSSSERLLKISRGAYSNVVARLFRRLFCREWPFVSTFMNLLADQRTVADSLESTRDWGRFSLDLWNFVTADFYAFMFSCTWPMAIFDSFVVVSGAIGKYLEFKQNTNMFSLSMYHDFTIGFYVEHLCLHKKFSYKFVLFFLNFLRIQNVYRTKVHTSLI